MRLSLLLPLHLLLISLPLSRASSNTTTDSSSSSAHNVAKKGRQPRQEKIGECPTSPFRMTTHRTPPKAPPALTTTVPPLDIGNSSIGGIASPPPALHTRNVLSRDLGLFSEHQKQHHKRDYQKGQELSDGSGGINISQTYGGHRLNAGSPYYSSPPQLQRCYSSQLQPQQQPQYGYHQNYPNYHTPPPHSPVHHQQTLQPQSFSPMAPSYTLSPQSPRLDYYGQRMMYGGTCGSTSSPPPPPPPPPQQQQPSAYCTQQQQQQHYQQQQRYNHYETEQQMLYLQQQHQQQQQQHYYQQQQHYLQQQQQQQRDSQHSSLPLPPLPPLPPMMSQSPPPPHPSKRHHFKVVQRKGSIDIVSEGSDSEIGKINFPSADEDDEEDLKVSNDSGLGFGFEQDKHQVVMTEEEHDDVGNNHIVDNDDEPFKILEAFSEDEIMKRFSDLQVDVDTSPTTTTSSYTPPHYRRKMSPISPEDKRSYKGELVVATWNVSSLRATEKDRLKRVAQRLKEQNADVIILTEVVNTDNTVSAIRAILGSMYREYLFNCRDTHLGMGVAILSKMKLDDNLTPSPSPSMSLIGASPTSCYSNGGGSSKSSNSSTSGISPCSYDDTKTNLTGRRSPSLEAAAKSGIIKGTLWDDQGRPVKIAIVALHLLARGGGGLTPEDRAVCKENQAYGIRNEIDHLSTYGNYNIIVGGDFNAPDNEIPDGGTCCFPATRTLEIIKGKDLRNAAGHLRRPKTHRSGLIDHILVDSAFSVLDTTIVESSKESDHSILVTKICISDTPHYYTASFTKGHRSSSGSPLTLDGMCYLETPPPKTTPSPKTTQALTSSNIGSRSPSLGLHPLSLKDRSRSTNSLASANCSDGGCKRSFSSNGIYFGQKTSAPPSILESLMGSIQGNSKSK